MRCFGNLAGLILTVQILMLCACLPKVMVSETKPGEELFARAENQYNQGLYNSAFNLYQDYLDRFPDGNKVAATLLRTGDILSMRGEYADARGRYDRLITQFSGSRFVEDAGIGMLLSWYNEKQYQKVFDYAETIRDEQVSDDCVARKYAVVSDAYLALEEPVDAAYVLISALKKPGPEGQKKILVKLDQISGRIGAEILQMLLADIKDPDFRGYLSCQIARRYIQKENYEQAVIVLSDFITAYPDHAYAGKAEEMLRQMEGAADYDRYAIGCLLPLSGEYRLFGERALKGIQLAFQEFVTASCRNGASAIKLVVEDTGSNPAQALSAVRSLADKKVAAIIGPLVSFKGAIREAENLRIPVITLSQEQNIPGLGKYVFRNFLTPRMQVETLAGYACRTLGLRKFAVLYPDEEYGKIFANIFWDEILKYGGEMVGYESYNPTETDFAESIKKLVGMYYPVPEILKEVREQRLIKLGLKVEKEEEEGTVVEEAEGAVIPELPDDSTETIEEEQAAGEPPEMETEDQEEEEEETALVDFEALFVPDGPSNAGLIIPQLAFYDVVDTLLLGTNLWYSRELIDTAGWYAQGAVLPADFWETGQSGGRKGSFSFRYERFYNEKPGFVQAVAYDTALILMDIISDPDVRFRHSIVDRLGKIEGHQGVTGTTTFDESGEVHKALTLLQIRGSRFVKIGEENAGAPGEQEFSLQE